MVNLRFWQPRPEQQAATQVAEARKETGNKIDEALNDGKFTTFLAENYPDQIDNLDVSDDPEASKDLLTKYETYQKIDKVSKEVSSIIKSEVLKDTGVELSAEDLECISKYLSKEAVTNGPGILNDLTEQTAKFKASSNKIRGNEQTIKDAADAYGARRDSFDSVQNLGWFKQRYAEKVSRITHGRLMSDSASKMENAKNQGLDLSNLRATRVQLDKEEETLGQLGELQNQLSESRLLLIHGLTEGTEIFSKIQQAVREKLAEALSRKSELNDLKKVGKYYNRLSGYRESGDIDYLPSDYDNDNFEQELDYYLQVRIRDLAKEAITSFETNKSRQLSGMESKLNKFFNEVKEGFGYGLQKDSYELHDFVGETLVELYDDSTDSVKKLLIKRISLKNGYDLDEFRGYNSLNRERARRGHDVEEESSEETPAAEPGTSPTKVPANEHIAPEADMDPPEVDSPPTAAPGTISDRDKYSGPGGID